MLLAVRSIQIQCVDRSVLQFPRAESAIDSQHIIKHYSHCAMQAPFRSIVDYWPVCQICAFDRGVPHFGTFVMGEPLNSEQRNLASRN